MEAVAIKDLTTAPVMVTCGDPWSTTLFYIVVDQQAILQVNEMCQAMCMLFATYYVLNYQYPKPSKRHSGINCTMTFLQKCIFKIKDKLKIPSRVE